MVLFYGWDKEALLLSNGCDALNPCALYPNSE